MNVSVVNDELVASRPACTTWSLITGVQCMHA